MRMRLAAIPVILCALGLRAQPAPRTVRPDTVRGLYVSRWAAVDTSRIAHLVQLATVTEVNTLVIDVKDDRGYVLYGSSVPLAHAIGADTIQPMPAARVRALLDTLRARHIHAVARIVVAKDPLLARARPEWSVARKDTGQPWLDENGQPWLDAHHREIWQYAADLAAEAVGLGFGEVQFDYVRFPDDPRLLTEAQFPLANGRPRAQLIHEQLGFLHDRMKALKAPMAIDVFGLTTSDTLTDMGIGQTWEQFATQTDIVLPMTYPSHYSEGLYGLANPNASPYQVIDHALKDAKRRNARLAHAPKIVPWYQDFTQGDPPYGVEQVRAQMHAGYDNGVMSWILWNPGSAYTEAALLPRRR